jgi:CheY-like chemotaxis protein
MITRKKRREPRQRPVHTGRASFDDLHDCTPKRVGPPCASVLCGTYLPLIPPKRTGTPTQRHFRLKLKAMPIRGNSLQRAAASVPRVLIVDDLQSSTSLEVLLHESGYPTTHAAASGATALQIAQQFSPSIVLLALDLPDMSAYDLAWRLRELTELRGVRLIALTADYEHAYRDLARRAGFERFLAKPVSGTDLRALLPANRT